MTAERCRFCQNQAAGIVQAQGLTSPIMYCDADACWSRAWAQAAGRIPRSWGPLPRRKGRRPAVNPGQGDLFDQPMEG